MRDLKLPFPRIQENIIKMGRKSAVLKTKKDLYGRVKRREAHDHLKVCFIWVAENRERKSFPKQCKTNE